MRFWQATPPKTCGLTRWDGASSSAVSNVPSDLLQSNRDEVGRLNQRALVRDDMAVDVMVRARVGRERGLHALVAGHAAQDLRPDSLGQSHLLGRYRTRQRT